MSDVTWLPIPGYEGFYEASDDGRVRSLPRRHSKGRILKAGATKAGYAQVQLCALERRGVRLVHALVMETFVGPCPDGQEVRHLDGDPGNNKIDNLRYGTRSQNNLDAVDHGTHHWARKTHCPRGHPYDQANTQVYRGYRYCRACRSAKPELGRV